MGCGHPDVSQDCGYVIGKVGVVVGSLILGDIRRRIATGGVRDAAIVAREITHLGFPLPMVRGELVHEYDRIPGPGFFDVELYSIGVSVRHAGLLVIATVPSDSARRVTSRERDRHNCRRSRNDPTVDHYKLFFNVKGNAQTPCQARGVYRGGAGEPCHSEKTLFHPLRSW